MTTKNGQTNELLDSSRERQPPCPSPDWSDNCKRVLETDRAKQKGLCEGCMSVIRSWNDTGHDDGREQTTLIPDGGRCTSVRERIGYSVRTKPSDSRSGRGWYVCDGCGLGTNDPDIAEECCNDTGSDHDE